MAPQLCDHLRSALAEHAEVSLLWEPVGAALVWMGVVRHRRASTPPGTGARDVVVLRFCPWCGGSLEPVPPGTVATEAPSGRPTMEP